MFSCNMAQITSRTLCMHAGHLILHDVFFVFVFLLSADYLSSSKLNFNKFLQENIPSEWLTVWNHIRP